MGYAKDEKTHETEAIGKAFEHQTDALYNLATFASGKMQIFSVSTRLPLLSADGSKFTTNHPYSALADFHPSTADEGQSAKTNEMFGIRTQTVYSVSQDGRITYVTPTDGYRFDWMAEGASEMQREISSL